MANEIGNITQSLISDLHQKEALYDEIVAEGERVASDMQAVTDKVVTLGQWLDNTARLLGDRQYKRLRDEHMRQDLAAFAPKIRQAARMSNPNQLVMRTLVPSEPPPLEEGDKGETPKTTREQRAVLVLLQAARRGTLIGGVDDALLDDMLKAIGSCLHEKQNS